MAVKYKAPKNIREKKSKINARKEFWIIFLIEAGLFLITSVLAVVSAFELNKLVKAQKIYLPKLSLQDFLFSFLFITFFVLLFISFKKASKFKELIYRGFFSIVIMLLVIFSFYDFIAVYKTKHMVAMAKEMIDKKVILGFIIPKEIKFFKNGLDKVKPGGNFLILGGGDIVFPNLLAVSVVPFGFLKALIIVLFSLIGSLFSYWIFINQKNKEPIPALPPVALFTIIGYFVALLLPL